MTGELMINGTDAFTAWGVSLEDGALDALMAFRPNKEPVVNKNVTSAGAVVISQTVGHVDERTVSIPMHICARNKSDLLTKRAGFLNAINGGSVTLSTPTTGDSYTLYYISCSQYTQLLGGIAKFILTMYEPNS